MMKRAIVIVLILIISSLLLIACDIVSMPYEEIDGDFLAEKYSSYAELTGSTTYSKLTTTQKASYGQSYFNTKNLIIIKFNSEYANISHLMKEVVYTPGACSVKVQPLINNNVAEEGTTTYYCFVETANEIADMEVSFELLAPLYSDAKISGIKTVNSLGGETDAYDHMGTYLIKSFAGISEIASENPQFTDVSAYDEAFFATHDLLVIDVPLTIKGSAIQYESGVVTVYNLGGVPVDELLGDGNSYSFSVYALAIPDGADITQINYNYLFSYNSEEDAVKTEDELDSKAVTATIISENLTELTFTE